MGIICIADLTLCKKFQKFQLEHDRFCFCWRGLRYTKLSQWGLSHEFQLELKRQFKVGTWITQTTTWPLGQQHQKHQDIANNKKEVQADQSWGSSRKVKFCSSCIGNIFLWILMITCSLHASPRNLPSWCKISVVSTVLQTLHSEMLFENTSPVFPKVSLSHGGSDYMHQKKTGPCLCSSLLWCINLSIKINIHRVRGCHDQFIKSVTFWIPDPFYVMEDITLDLYS